MADKQNYISPSGHLSTFGIPYRVNPDGTYSERVVAKRRAVSTATILRPNNVTPYTDKDVIQHHLELLINGNFDSATGADWTTWVESAGDGAIAAETSIVKTAGGKALKLTAGATKNTLTKNTFVTEASKSYTLTFWQQNTTAGAGKMGRYVIRNETGSADIVALAASVDAQTYALNTVTFTTPVGCISTSVSFQCADTNAAVCYFDDASVILTGSVKECLTFTNCAPEVGGSGYVGGVTMLTDNPSVILASKLWLFTAPVTPAEDNSPFAPSLVELQTCIGAIVLNDATATGTTGQAGVTSAKSLPFVCGAATTSLYGVLVDTGTQTPKALENITLKLHIVQDA